MYLNWKVSNILICSFYAAYLMLSDINCHQTMETFSFGSQTPKSYKCSLDTFHVCLIVFEILAEGDSAAAETLPSGKNNSIRKSRPDFLSVVCWYIRLTLTVFELFTWIRFAATEAPPGGDNIFIQKLDPDFLSVVRWHFRISLTNFELFA